jgi:hypothetical protein
METVTRETVVSLLQSYALGRTALADIRTWIGRIVAADDIEIADEDAAAVAPVINVFEDSSIEDSELPALAGRIADILGLGLSGEKCVALIALVVNARRLSELLQRVACGQISDVALGNALSRTQLPLGVRRWLERSSPQQRARIARALTDGDVRMLDAAMPV